MRFEGELTSGYFLNRHNSGMIENTKYTSYTSTLWLFIQKVVAKLTWGLVIAFIINEVSLINFSPILLDSDSDSDSGSKPSPKGKGIADPSSKSPESKFDIDNINNANVTAEQLTEEPRSTLGTKSAFDSRINAMMSKFLALNLESLKDEIERLGLHKREASTSHEQELLDRYARESAALAHSSQEELKAKLQLEKDKITFGKAQPSSTSTGVKREASTTSQTISKKPHLDASNDSDSDSR